MRDQARELRLRIKGLLWACREQFVNRLACSMEQKLAPLVGKSCKELMDHIRLSEERPFEGVRP